MEGYSLNKPLTYKEWTAMPDDIQIEYWTKLRERFPNIANSRIRRDMLLTSEPTLNKELERLGLPRHPVVDGVVKNTIHSSYADLDEWDKWLGRVSEEEKKQEITATALDHMEERKERKKANRCAVNNIATQLYGTNESLYTELKGLLSYLPEGNYVVEVQIKRTGKYHEQE